MAKILAKQVFSLIVEGLFLKINPIVYCGGIMAFAE